MDDIKLVTSKTPQHSVKRGISHGVTTRDRSLDSAAAVGVGVLVFVSRVSSGKDVNGMALMPEFTDECVDAYADAIKNRQGAVGKDGHPKTIGGHR